ncbi:glycosyltransferase [Pyrobaculum aerophilum]|nr:glycosyltransferase [Pyrobaculum aerophilum]MCX8137678.1 glycosyltransferase [Pyrobaculum aerophilum]
MKIVHVHHHYWPVVGGLENAVKALAEEQARLGHEVHVVTSAYGAEGRPR